MRFLSFYHMKENPFGESPNANFYFSTATHESVLKKLLWGIQENKGILFTTGSVGSGKTLLLRVLYEKLVSKSYIATLMNPNLDPQQTLEAIYREFGISERPELSKLDVFANFLVSAENEGKRCLILVDEAQGLKEDTLEFLRILTNLETSERKLLQVVLFAQPEMEKKVQHPRFEQLQQRIFLQLKIDRLTKEETKSYIQHRLETSGGGNFVRFDESATTWIWTQSRGNPRVINKICEACLLFGSIHSIRRFSKAEMNRIPLKEFGISPVTFTTKLLGRLGL